MNVDPSGTSILVTLGILVAGAAIGAIFGGIRAYKQGKRGWELAGSVLLGAAAGAGAAGLFISAGAAITLAIGKATFLFAPVLQSFAIGALAYNGFGIIAMAMGYEVSLLETGTSVSVPEPKPTPRHPAQAYNYDQYLNFVLKKSINWKAILKGVAYDTFSGSIINGIYQSY